MNQYATFRAGLLAAAFSIFVVAGPARADIITALSSTLPTAVPGGFSYTYNVELTGQQQLDPAGGASIEFGTVYDFGPSIGFLTATGYLAQFFTFSRDLSDPPASQTAPFDDPTISNIRFVYNGSSAFSVNNSTNANTILLPSTVNNLGTFTLVSPLSDVSHNVQYDGQARKATNDTITGNVGFTSGPNVAVLVPEPASLLLLGAGLAGAGLLRRRKATLRA